MTVDELTDRMVESSEDIEETVAESRKVLKRDWKNMGSLSLLIISVSIILFIYLSIKQNYFLFFLHSFLFLK
jgi:hypothetical protein